MDKWGTERNGPESNSESYFSIRPDNWILNCAKFRMDSLPMSDGCCGSLMECNTERFHIDTHSGVGGTRNMTGTELPSEGKYV
jgi:hypothetical protein